MSSTTPGAPPGWYPDPAGSGYPRWWDGVAWGPVTAPPPAAMPFSATVPPGAGTEPGERPAVAPHRPLLAWWTALAPLATLGVAALVAALLPQLGILTALSAGAGAGLLTGLVPAWLDARRLAGPLLHAPWVVALLAAWPYLVVRAIRARTPGAVVAAVAGVVVWGAVGAASIPVTAAVQSANLRFDRAGAERAIAAGFDEQVSGRLGLAPGDLTPVATCPASPSMRPGSTFDCVVEAGGKRFTAQVTIEDRTGSYVWRVA